MILFELVENYLILFELVENMRNLLDSLCSLEE